MNTGEILREAAYLVGQPNGWLQEVFSNREVGGSLQDATAFCATSVIFSSQCEATQYVAKLVPPPSYSYDTNHQLVARWNNAYGRTQDEVVKMLLDAAELWEKDQITLDKQEEVLVA